MNFGGTVGLTAALDAGGTGLFLSSPGGPLTQVADASGQFSGLGLGSLNDSGTLGVRRRPRFRRPIALPPL